MDRPRRRDRVLLVAPQNDDTTLLAGLFATAGFALSTVFDQPGALELCGGTLPDSVVVDLDTPTLDALSLVRTLRQLDGGAALNVVAITSLRATAIPNAQLRAAGVDIEVGRPATVTKLIDALGSCARSR